MWKRKWFVRPSPAPFLHSGCPVNCKGITDNLDTKVNGYYINDDTGFLETSSTEYFPACLSILLLCFCFLLLLHDSGAEQTDLWRLKGRSSICCCEKTTNVTKKRWIKSLLATKETREEIFLLFRKLKNTNKYRAVVQFWCSAVKYWFSALGVNVNTTKRCFIVIT